MTRSAPLGSSLTRSLDDKGNPIRRFVDDLLTSKDGLRALRTDHAAVAGQLLVDTEGATAGTVGTAFGIAVTMLIDPVPDFGFAASGAANLGAEPFAAFCELATAVGGTYSRPEERTPATKPVMTPLRVPERDAELVVRTTWAMALFTEVYRAGAFPGSPLMTYLEREAHPTASGLLAITSAAAANEIDNLLRLARTNLLAPLSPAHPPWFVGPTFAASRWLAADADLIAGTTLVEIKSNLGDRRKDGTRRANLDLVTLRQIVGYVLHDVDDRYHLDSIAIYDARYGALMTRPLQPLLNQLAGRTVDLAATRAAYFDLLLQLADKRNSARARSEA
jgi:hypothetical protein